MDLFIPWVFVKECGIVYVNSVEYRSYYVKAYGVALPICSPSTCAKGHAEGRNMEGLYVMEFEKLVAMARDSKTIKNVLKSLV